MPPRQVAILAAAIASVMEVGGLLHSRSAKLYRRRRLRSFLPQSLRGFRELKNGNAEGVWDNMSPLLAEWGLISWEYGDFTDLMTPDDTYLFSPGFAHITASRGLEGPVHTAEALKVLLYHNGLIRYVRTRDGNDAVLRPIVMRDEGRTCIDVIRKLSMPPQSLFCENHTLPLLRELTFEDMVFVLYPLVGSSVRDAFDLRWRRNSVGDLMDMLLQSLEALEFIHNHRIAHQDAFYDNFLLQWQPESLRTTTIPASRPRVYLVDFEFAMAFPIDEPMEKCLRSGKPHCDSAPDETYCRPIPETLAGGQPMNAFQLDLWQLAEGYSRVQTSIPELDKFLSTLDAKASAGAALRELNEAIGSMCPGSLLIPPVIIEAEY